MSEQASRDWWEELLQVYEFAHYRQYADELTCREVDFLIDALGLRGVETILDVACGGGRHSLALAARGWTVVGLDAAESVIAHARAAAVERGLSVEFVHGDMRNLPYSDRFDVVLLMNSSLGFFDDETNQAVLNGIARALVPGGKLLVQSLNPYQIDRYLRDFRSGWYPIGSGFVLREARFDPRRATLTVNYRYIDARRGIDVTHPGDHIRLYGFPELTAMLRAAGLRPLSVFGDAVLPPVPFAEESIWQVVIATRDRPVRREAADADQADR
ncbi:MAG: class I SAM-dependent methyltransferase [Chloroflexus sp.]